MTILSVEQIQVRLQAIFPEGSEQRTYITREMAAKTVFVCLYANAIEGLDRWIRPNQVCRMTEAQSAIMDDAARGDLVRRIWQEWVCAVSGYALVCRHDPRTYSGRNHW